jgi:hypothetical protein
LNAIAKKLDQIGVPTPSRRRKVAEYWWANTVKNILTNEIYIGKGHFGKLRVINGKRVKQPKEEWIEIDVPELAIVDKQVFEAVQNRANRNKRRASRNKKRHYLLSGHGRCGTCGYSIGAHTKLRKSFAETRYYCCGTHFLRRDKRCPNKSITFRADEVEGLVWNWLVWLLSDDANLDAGIDTLVQQRENDNAPNLSRLETVNDLIDDAETRLGRLIEELSHHDDQLILGAIREKINMVKKDWRLLVEEREKLGEEIGKLVITEDYRVQLKKFAASIRGRLPTADYAAKRQLLDLFDVQVHFLVDGQGKRLKITCNVPLFDVEVRIEDPAHHQMPEWPRQLVGVSHDSETEPIASRLL